MTATLESKTMIVSLLKYICACKEKSTLNHLKEADLVATVDDSNVTFCTVLYHFVPYHVTSYRDRNRDCDRDRELAYTYIRKNINCT